MATAQMNGLVRYLRRVSMAGDRVALTDGDLLTRFLTLNDADAFEAIVRRHGPAVLAICRQVLGNDHDAEDAFQATFLVLLHKARSIANPEVVGSWLYGTAHYTARNARLSLARRRTHEQRAGHMAPIATTEPIMSAADLQPLLEEVARLPEKLRAPLTLCELQGKSRVQAAKLLNCREGTLSSRLARGRALLRTRLASRGFQFSIGALATACTRETLRATLPASLVARTMRTLAAWMSGDVAKVAGIAGQTVALTKVVLHGLAANQLKIWLLWLVGLATLTGTGALVQRDLFAPTAEASAFSASLHTPKQQEKARLDLHGDPLPAGALARLGTVRLRPGNEVTAVAFSPDGSKLASGPIYANVVQIWDRASGRLLLECRGHNGTLMQIAFTGDGRNIISSSLDKTVRVWDAATGAERYQLPTPWPGNFALTPDGRTLAMSNQDRAIHLWEIDTGKEIRALKVGIEDSIRQGFEPIALAFSADGRRLATADRDSLRLWDVATGRLESSTENRRRGDPLAACFNGSTVTVLSSAYGAPYTLWSLPIDGEPRTVRVEPGKLAQFAFAPGGGSLLFSAYGTGVREWDTASGTETKRLAGMQGDARALAYSPDGKIAAAGTDRATLHVWEVASGAELDKHGERAAAVDSVAIARDGRTVATTSADGSLRVWDPATGRLRWQLLEQGPVAPTSTAISPDGSKVVAGGLGKGIRVYEAASGKLLAHLLTAEPAGVRGFSNDGQSLLCIHQGRTVGWLDLATGRERSQYPAPATGAEFINFARWNPKQQIFHAPCSAASANGRLAALGDQTKLSCVKEDGPGKVRLVFETQLDAISCLAFSADAKQLATAGDDPFVLIWDVAGGKPSKQLAAQGQVLTALAYSPDGRVLAAGTNRGAVLLWDMATGEQIARRAGHPSAIQQLAFTPDSKLLVSAGGTDTTALIWDVAVMRR
ncbi:MAG TPA: sigma-70 family RNA polymerase sigma factor [Gemmataceae bacterium]|nr:sigma-70 family RNA polymerase sigma factor [Gemmataceae bacterium]